MTGWDGAALARLEAVAADLRAAGVVDLLEERVSRVWRYNVDRYEPTEIGDTPRATV